MFPKLLPFHWPATLNKKKYELTEPRIQHHHQKDQILRIKLKIISKFQRNFPFHRGTTFMQ